MRFVDIELSIRVDETMDAEDINEMIERSTTFILRQYGVLGVGSSDWAERIVTNDGGIPF